MRYSISASPHLAWQSLLPLWLDGRGRPDFLGADLLHVLLRVRFGAGPFAEPVERPIVR